MYSIAKPLGHLVSIRHSVGIGLRPPLVVRQMSIFKSKGEKTREKKEIIRRKNRFFDPDPEREKDLPTYVYASKTPMNKIYTWGMACFGALGVPEYVRPVKKHQEPFKTMHRPARANFAEKHPVVDVACGYGFTIFALNSKSHHLMGCGINRDGQIGYHAPRKNCPLEVIIRPAGVRLPVRDPDSTKAVKVAAGRAHALVLTNDGDIFSLGNNAYGQCGRVVIENEDYLRNEIITKVKGDWLQNNDVPTAIECGQDHSIILTQKGKIYSCGWSADGQTGVGHYDSISEATEAVGDVKNENIAKVSSSSDCVLALNDKGEVFGWGNSEYGQFASSTEDQQVCTPHKLNLDGLGKIIDVACGGTVCIVLNENRDVFVWGYGILGKGPDLEYSKVPVQIPNTLFGRTEFTPDVFVEKIFCGVNTNAAVNSGGELFMWGKNKGSCLGLGDYKDQFFPLKVSLIYHVKDLSLGVDHSAAICKPWT